MRLLAPIALIAAAVVLVVVVAGSLNGSGDDGGRDRPAGQQEQSASNGSEEEDKFYVVQPGDSFSTIAEEQGVPEERLQQLNPDLDPQALVPGVRVKLR
jgi:LysM repeat protein